MLTDLQIENILLIDKTNIHFHSGFSVITGQTGAGKSILLDSLNIILGERAGVSLLRNPEKHGIIVATFDVENEEVREQLYDGGFISNEQEKTIIIKKIITKNGSKIFINDIQTTLQFITSISHFLLEIYSQFEQTDLFSIKKHLDILDKFGNLKNELVAIKHLFNEMKSEQENYEKVKNDIARQKENADYLQAFVDDMNALKLSSGEYDELVNQKKNMTDTSKVSTYISKAYDTFCESKFGTLINKVQVDLQKAQGNLEDGELNKEIESINEVLEKLYIDYQNADEMLGDLAKKNNFDETTLNEIEERIACINEIARKYQTTPLELEKQFNLAKDKLSKIELSDDILKKMEEKVKEKEKIYYIASEKMSQKRKEFAKKLEQEVIDKLHNLKMEKVVFYASFEVAEATETGTDKVVFFASMNPGMAPAPIHKIASGGELSRFMLAFKSALCSAQSTSTIIFDEIDTGVSGNVAFAIGKEMQKLAENTQVICITHNSQTASCGANHYLVEKEQTLDDTKTLIKVLNYEERVKTIAEMISSDEITNEALQNARILLEKAQI